MSNQKPMTYFSSPSETIKSGYGKIKYREWCEKEIERMAKKGTVAKIVTREDGFIALSR
jgi:hypothetical protein